LAFKELILQILYWIYEIAIYSCVFILDLPISIWQRIGLLLVCLTVYENAGMPENSRFTMDYEYQEKKKGIY
jgi:hypothetical protein